MFRLTSGNWGKRFLKNQTIKHPMAVGLLRYDDLYTCIHFWIHTPWQMVYCFTRYQLSRTLAVSTKQPGSGSAHYTIAWLFLPFHCQKLWCMNHDPADYLLPKMFSKTYFSVLAIMRYCLLAARGITVSFFKMESEPKPSTTQLTGCHPLVWVFIGLGRHSVFWML